MQRLPALSVLHTVVAGSLAELRQSLEQGLRPPVSQPTLDILLSKQAELKVCSHAQYDPAGSLCMHFDNLSRHSTAGSTGFRFGVNAAPCLTACNADALDTSSRAHPMLSLSAAGHVDT